MNGSDFTQRFSTCQNEPTAKTLFSPQRHQEREEKKSVKLDNLTRLCDFATLRFKSLYFQWCPNRDSRLWARLEAMRCAKNLPGSCSESELPTLEPRSSAINGTTHRQASRKVESPPNRGTPALPAALTPGHSRVS